MGMIMQAQPLHSCWKHICDDAGRRIHTIMMSPCGKVYKQEFHSPEVDGKVKSGIPRTPLVETGETTKKHGIYVDMNLHVARFWDERDGFVLGGPWANKGTDNFVKRMIEEDQDCADVLMQLSASRSALTGLGKEIINEHITHCITHAVQDGDMEAIEEFQKAIEKFC